MFRAIDRSVAVFVNVTFRAPVVWIVVTPLTRVKVVTTSLLVVMSRRTGKLHGLLPSVSVRMNGSGGGPLDCLVGGAAAATEVTLNTTTSTAKTAMGVRKPLDLGERKGVNCCSSFGSCERLGGDDVDCPREAKVGPDEENRVAEASAAPRQEPGAGSTVGERRRRTDEVFPHAFPPLDESPRSPCPRGVIGQSARARSRPAQTTRHRPREDRRVFVHVYLLRAGGEHCEEALRRPSRRPSQHP